LRQRINFWNIPGISLRILRADYALITPTQTLTRSERPRDKGGQTPDPRKPPVALLVRH
jgi:hypothetical protein